MEMEIHCVGTLNWSFIFEPLTELPLFYSIQLAWKPQTLTCAVNRFAAAAIAARMQEFLVVGDVIGGHVDSASAAGAGVDSRPVGARACLVGGGPGGGSCGKVGWVGLRDHDDVAARLVVQPVAVAVQPEGRIEIISNEERLLLIYLGYT